MSERVVIVGAGHAALRFCEEMRGHGFNGSLTVIGNEAHRPYERPPLSKAVLCGEAIPGDHSLLSADNQSLLAIDWHGGARVERIDRSGRNIVLADDSVYPYDRLVLATGVTPRRLDCPGSGLTGIHYLGDAECALRLRDALDAAPQSVVIIGGGFIGLEVAAAARRQGHHVTVVESAPRCIGRLFPPSLSRSVTDLHQRNGVVIKAGVGVTAIVGRDRATGVQLMSGETLTADLVVVGIGSLPQTELAEGCGLAVSNGILVDPAGCTSDCAIYAIGDVAAVKDGADASPVRRESWDNAQTMAQRAAAAMMDMPQPQPKPLWFWTDQYDHNIQFIGEAGDDCDELHIERDGGGSLYLYARQGALVAAGLVDAGRERRRIMTAIGNREPIAVVAAAFGAQTLQRAS